MSNECTATCECGDEIEEIDGGNGYTYWAHVRVGRVEFDHSAVPVCAGCLAERRQIRTLILHDRCDRARRR
jgi:hypothetical protein